VLPGALAADVSKPAADSAAQVATALALLAHYFRTAQAVSQYMSGPLADRCADKAAAAYAYAAAMYRRDGAKSTCNKSKAMSNCIGTCKDTGEPVRSNRTHESAVSCSLNENDQAAQHCTTQRMPGTAPPHPSKCDQPHFGSERECARIDTRSLHVRPCELYGSGNSPQRHLFTAAAAMYQLTAKACYHADASNEWAQLERITAPL
jgi:hypothetical protein